MALLSVTRPPRRERSHCRYDLSAGQAKREVILSSGMNLGPNDELTMIFDEFGRNRHRGVVATIVSAESPTFVDAPGQEFRAAPGWTACGRVLTKVDAN